MSPIDYGTLHLWATPDAIVLDRVTPKRKGQERERLRTIPLDQVESITVDAISGERRDFHWKPTTGFLGRGTKVPAVSGVLIVLRHGEHVLLRMPGRAPIEAQADLGPLIAAVRSRKPSA